MKITIERDPGQAGEHAAQQAKGLLAKHGLGDDVNVVSRSMPRVDSASDARTANNAVRHAYRVLSDEEKAQMVAVKDKGAEFLALLDDLHTPSIDHGDGTATGTFDRELVIAKERVEEAVMWAVKHLTA